MILGNPITLGGGIGKAFAVIGVTYSAGLICTCTDGSKTLTLKDTSGQGFFMIPYAGTWTVTATDGTNTNSESVEITTEGQSVSVVLDYTFYLYNNGTITNCNWETLNTAKCSLESNYMKLEGDSYKDSGFQTSKSRLIRISGYTYLCIEYTAKEKYTNGICLQHCGVYSTDLETQIAVADSPTNISLNTKTIMQIPVNSLSGNYRVRVLVGMNSACKANIHRIWFE